MPLYSGSKNIRRNISELNTGKVGKSRKKAIRTLAKKWHVSEKEARFKQSLIIAKKKASEK